MNNSANVYSLGFLPVIRKERLIRLCTDLSRMLK